MEPQPEPCTTSSGRKRHYSTDLTAGVEHKVGRVGTTLCGEEAQDEEEANRFLGSIWGRKVRIVVASLPECQRCGRKMAAAGFRPAWKEV